MDTFDRSVILQLPTGYDLADSQGQRTIDPTRFPASSRSGPFRTDADSATAGPNSVYSWIILIGAGTNLQTSNSNGCIYLPNGLAGSAPNARSHRADNRCLVGLVTAPHSLRQRSPLCRAKRSHGAVLRPDIYAQCPRTLAS